MKRLFLFLIFSASSLAAHSPYYIVFLVDARGLDYSGNRAFFKTLAKHPSDWSKNGDVGHAWIYLHGLIDGNCWSLEGGHSGELGLQEPKYFEGVMDLVEEGDPDPVHYLWEVRDDGYFEKGSGGHAPTYAVKVDLTPEQFDDIRGYIRSYPYRQYAITKNQCCSFVAGAAAMLEIDLPYEVTMRINPVIKLGGVDVRLWSNSRYASITFGSPDLLQKSLRQLVCAKKGIPVLNWYRKTHPMTWKKRWTAWRETLTRFPFRFRRARFFCG